jgi:hypothetical protein
MPLLHVLLSILQFFLLVAWIGVVVAVISDVFRSKDLNGVERVLWVLGVIIVPWVGVLVYLFIRGESMAERTEQARADDAAMRRFHIRNVAGLSTADEIKKLVDLKAEGIITDDELQAQKGKLLS